MSKISKSIYRSAIPVLAATASLAVSAEKAPASTGESLKSARKAPTAKRVAYCMRQILRSSDNPSIRYHLKVDPETGERTHVFKTEVAVKPVKDRLGKNCVDVAKRSVQSELSINGESSTGFDMGNGVLLGQVTLSGNIVTGRTGVRMGVTEQHCEAGEIEGFGMAEVQADPVDPSQKTRVRTHTTPTITADCRQ
jgi:hypothetical protein